MLSNVRNGTVREKSSHKSDAKRNANGVYTSDKGWSQYTSTTSRKVSAILDELFAASQTMSYCVNAFWNREYTSTETGCLSTHFTISPKHGMSKRTERISINFWTRLYSRVCSSWHNTRVSNSDTRLRNIVIKFPLYVAMFCLKKTPLILKIEFQILELHQRPLLFLAFYKSQTTSAASNRNTEGVSTMDASPWGKCATCAPTLLPWFQCRLVACLVDAIDPAHVWRFVSCHVNCPWSQRES